MSEVKGCLLLLGVSEVSLYQGSVGVLISRMYARV